MPCTKSRPLAQAQIFSLDYTSQIREPRVGLPELNSNEAELETQAWAWAAQAFLVVQVRSRLLESREVGRYLGRWGGGEASERILLAHLEMGGRLLLPRVASPVGASSQDELWPPFRPSSPRRACAAIHKK